MLQPLHFFFSYFENNCISIKLRVLDLMRRALLLVGITIGNHIYNNNNIFDAKYGRMEKKKRYENKNNITAVTSGIFSFPKKKRFKPVRIINHLIKSDPN